MTPEDEERGRWQQATCYSTPMEANAALCSLQDRVAALRQERYALGAQIERLKPSGVVAEDETRLRHTLNARGAAPHTHDALTRLAAKAQCYEVIRKAIADNYGTDGEPLERVTELLESEARACGEARIEQDERHRVQNERDAAVADNAALLGAGRELHCLLEDSVSWEKREARRHAALALLDATHPGTALLERLKEQEARLATQAENIRWHQRREAEHAKALVRARNAARENMADACIAKRDSIPPQNARLGSRRSGLEEAARISRAMKEDEE